ncbi:MAG: DUF968 domain-containing protein [Mesorhizobium sp.]|nr:DUF968 domain-containing protein [Mesorhizobium sp.]
MAALECVLGDKWGHECAGRVTVHHAIGARYRGMGQKASHYDTIPLCEAHHQTSGNAIHLMGMRPWEAKYGTQRELIESTKGKLGG